MTATVVLAAGTSGTTVNMRASASKKGAIIKAVPVGTQVEVVEDLGTWCMIGYSGKTGYMMSNFLEYDGQDATAETDMDGAVKLDIEAIARIDKALKEIESAAEAIGSIVGRG